MSPEAEGSSPLMQRWYSSSFRLTPPGTGPGTSRSSKNSLFAITSGSVKCLGINLTKEEKDPYSENCRDTASHAFKRGPSEEPQELVRMCKNWNSCVLLVGSKMVQLLWKTVWHFLKILKMELLCAKLFQSCLTLCDPMDSSPPGSSVHGILKARILEWVAMPSSRGSSQPRN